MLNTPWLLTDNSNGPVMVIRNYHWLNSACRVLISTCSAPLVQTGERKQFSLFDLDLWHTTLTYNLILAKVKVKGQTVPTGERPQSNGHTHTHTHTHADATKRIISPATRSVRMILMSTSSRYVNWFERFLLLKPLRESILCIPASSAPPVEHVFSNSVGAVRVDEGLITLVRPPRVLASTVSYQHCDRPSVILMMICHE